MTDPLEYLMVAFNFLKGGVDNFWWNATHMWEGMDAVRYLRLVAIVGAYVLLRPYLQGFSEKIQAKQHMEAMNSAESETTAAISPNSLRGGQQKPLVADDSESEAEAATGADWGKKAHKRQRRAERKAMEAQQQARDEDDWTDPDVSDLLS